MSKRWDKKGRFSTRKSQNTRNNNRNALDKYSHALPEWSTASMLPYL